MSPAGLSQTPEKSSGAMRTVVSAVKGFVLTICIMFLSSVLLAVVGYEKPAEYTVTLVSMIIGAFFAGASSADKSASRRLLSSILSGIVFFAIVMLASVLLGRVEGLNWATVLSNLAISVLSAAIGAVARINSVKRNRAI